MPRHPAPPRAGRCGRRRHRARPGAPTRLRAARARRRASRGRARARRAPHGAPRRRRARADRSRRGRRDSRRAPRRCRPRGSRRRPAARASRGELGILIGRTLERASRLGEQGRHVGPRPPRSRAPRARSRPPGAALRSAPAARRAAASSTSSPGCGCDVLDLGERGAQLVGLARRAPRARRSAASVRARLRGTARYASRYAARASATGCAAEAVEGVALRGRRLQPQLVGLAVHDDELLGEVGEHPGRRRPAADGGAAASLARDGAADVAARRARRPIGSRSPPASRTRSATAPVSGTIHTPSTAACAAPARTAPESARCPSRSPRPVTTMVLPAPVSPVIAVKPRPDRQHRLRDDAEIAQAHLVDHAPRTDRCRGAP